MAEMNIAVDEMLAAVKVIDLVPEIAGFPSSAFVKLNPTAKNLELSLSAELSGKVQAKADGSLGTTRAIFCNRQLFFPFLKAGEKSKQPFTMSFAENRLLVRHGRRKALFDCAVAGMGYSELKTSGKATELPKLNGFLQSLLLSSSCATADPGAPELNCVFVRNLGKHLALYSSNQILCLHSDLTGKNSLPVKMALPLALLPHLDAKELKLVELYEKQVVLRFPNGALWHPVSLKALKEFPYGSIDQLLAQGKKLPEQFSLELKRVHSVLSRFVQYLVSATKQDWLLKIKATPGSKVAFLEVAVQQGVFKEKVSLQGEAKNAFELDLPLDLLFPVFEQLVKNHPDEKLSVSFDKKSPYFLTLGKSCLVVSRRKK